MNYILIKTKNRKSWKSAEFYQSRKYLYFHQIFYE